MSVGRRLIWMNEMVAKTGYRKQANIVFYGGPCGIGRLSAMLSYTRKKGVWKS